MRIWKRQPQLHTLAPALHDWYRTDLGQALLAVEQRLIDRRLTDCFGYHLLQLGVDSQLALFRESRVQRTFKAGLDDRTEREIAADGVPFARCDVEALPFESDSLDVVIVHHVLEFAADPHAVLRELQRVTVPQGRILLVGFNPWSLFGLRMAGGHLRRDSIWRNHLLSAARISDWLQLLGFESDRIEFGFHRPPLQRAAHWFDGSGERPWSRRWPFGGVYLITAIKQVAKFTPIRPRWIKAATLVPMPVAKPSISIGQPNKQRHLNRDGNETG